MEGAASEVRRVLNQAPEMCGSPPQVEETKGRPADRIFGHCKGKDMLDFDFYIQNQGVESEESRSPLHPVHCSRPSEAMLDSEHPKTACSKAGEHRACSDL